MALEDDLLTLGIAPPKASVTLPKSLQPDFLQTVPAGGVAAPDYADSLSRLRASYAPRPEPAPPQQAQPADERPTPEELRLLQEERARLEAESEEQKKVAPRQPMWLDASPASESFKSLALENPLNSSVVESAWARGAPLEVAQAEIAKESAKKGGGGSGILGGLNRMKDPFAAAGIAAATAPSRLAVGVGNILTGGYAGKLVDDASRGLENYFAKKFDDEAGLTGSARTQTLVGREGAETRGLGGLQNVLSEKLITEETRKAMENIQNAKGVGGVLSAIAENPLGTLTIVGRSAGDMIAGGAVGRMVRGAAGLSKAKMLVGPQIDPYKVSARLAASIGEGLQGLAAASESNRNLSPDGLLDLRRTFYSALSGAMTTALGFNGGRIAEKIGVRDADELLVSFAARNVSPAGRQAFASKVTNLAKGAMVEGFAEELPQSVAETITANLANGANDVASIMKGVPENATLGSVLGVIMGTTAQLPDMVRSPKNLVLTPAPDADGGIAPPAGSTATLTPTGGGAAATPVPAAAVPTNGEVFAKSMLDSDPAPLSWRETAKALVEKFKELDENASIKPAALASPATLAEAMGFAEELTAATQSKAVAEARELVAAAEARDPNVTAEERKTYQAAAVEEVVKKYKDYAKLDADVVLTAMDPAAAPMTPMQKAEADILKAREKAKAKAEAEAKKKTAQPTSQPSAQPIAAADQTAAPTVAELEARADAALKQLREDPTYRQLSDAGDPKAFENPLLREWQKLRMEADDARMKLAAEKPATKPTKAAAKPTVATQTTAQPASQPVAEAPAAEVFDAEAPSKAIVTKGIPKTELFTKENAARKKIREAFGIKSEDLPDIVPVGQPVQRRKQLLESIAQRETVLAKAQEAAKAAASAAQATPVAEAAASTQEAVVTPAVEPVATEPVAGTVEAATPAAAAATTAAVAPPVEGKAVSETEKAVAPYRAEITSIVEAFEKAIKERSSMTDADFNAASDAVRDRIKAVLDNPTVLEQVRKMLKSGAVGKNVAVPIAKFKMLAFVLMDKQSSPTRPNAEKWLKKYDVGGVGDRSAATAYFKRIASTGAITQGVQGKIQSAESSAKREEGAGEDVKIGEVVTLEGKHWGPYKVIEFDEDDNGQRTGFAIAERVKTTEETEAQKKSREKAGLPPAPDSGAPRRIRMPMRLAGGVINIGDVSPVVEGMENAAADAKMKQTIESLEKALTERTGSVADAKRLVQIIRAKATSVAGGLDVDTAIKGVSSKIADSLFPSVNGVSPNYEKAHREMQKGGTIVAGTQYVEARRVEASFFDTVAKAAGMVGADGNLVLTKEIPTEELAQGAARFAKIGAPQAKHDSFDGIIKAGPQLQFINGRLVYESWGAVLTRAYSKAAAVLNNAYGLLPIPDVSPNAKVSEAYDLMQRLNTPLKTTDADLAARLESDDLLKRASSGAMLSDSEAAEVQELISRSDWGATFGPDYNINDMIHMMRQVNELTGKAQLLALPEAPAGKAKAGVPRAITQADVQRGVEKALRIIGAQVKDKLKSSRPDFDVASTPFKTIFNKIATVLVGEGGQGGLLAESGDSVAELEVLLATATDKELGGWSVLDEIISDVRHNSIRSKYLSELADRVAIYKESGWTKILRAAMDAIAPIEGVKGNITKDVRGLIKARIRKGLGTPSQRLLLRGVAGEEAIAPPANPKLDAIVNPLIAKAEAAEAAFSQAMKAIGFQTSASPEVMQILDAVDKAIGGRLSSFVAAMPRIEKETKAYADGLVRGKKDAERDVVMMSEKVGQFRREAIRKAMKSGGGRTRKLFAKGKQLTAAEIKAVQLFYTLNEYETSKSAMKGFQQKLGPSAELLTGPSYEPSFAFNLPTLWVAKPSEQAAMQAAIAEWRRSEPFKKFQKALNKRVEAAVERSSKVFDIISTMEQANSKTDEQIRDAILLNNPEVRVGSSEYNALRSAVDHAIDAAARDIVARASALSKGPADNTVQGDQGMREGPIDWDFSAKDEVAEQQSISEELAATIRANMQEAPIVGREEEDEAVRGRSTQQMEKAVAELEARSDLSQQEQDLLGLMKKTIAERGELKPINRRKKGIGAGLTAGTQSQKSSDDIAINSAKIEAELNALREERAREVARLRDEGMSPQAADKLMAEPLGDPAKIAALRKVIETIALPKEVKEGVINQSLQYRLDFYKSQKARERIVNPPLSSEQPKMRPPTERIPTGTRYERISSGEPANIQAMSRQNSDFAQRTKSKVQGSLERDGYEQITLPSGRTITVVVGRLKESGGGIQQHENGWLIVADPTSAKISTIPHEVAHASWDMLTPVERGALRKVFGLEGADEAVAVTIGRMAAEGTPVPAIQKNSFLRNAWQKFQGLVSMALGYRWVPAHLRAEAIIGRMRSGEVVTRSGEAATAEGVRFESMSFPDKLTDLRAANPAAYKAFQEDANRAKKASPAERQNFYETWKNSAPDEAAGNPETLKARQAVEADLAGKPSRGVPVNQTMAGGRNRYLAVKRYLFDDLNTMIHSLGKNSQAWYQSMDGILGAQTKRAEIEDAANLLLKPTIEGVEAYMRGGPVTTDLGGVLSSAMTISKDQAYMFARLFRNKDARAELIRIFNASKPFGASPIILRNVSGKDVPATFKGTPAQIDAAMKNYEKSFFAAHPNMEAHDKALDDLFDNHIYPKLNAEYKKVYDTTEDLPKVGAYMAMTRQHELNISGKQGVTGSNIFADSTQFKERTRSREAFVVSGYSTMIRRAINNAAQTVGYAVPLRTLKNIAQDKQAELDDKMGVGWTASLLAKINETEGEYSRNPVGPMNNLIRASNISALSGPSTPLKQLGVLAMLPLRFGLTSVIKNLPSTITGIRSGMERTKVGGKPMFTSTKIREVLKGEFAPALARRLSGDLSVDNIHNAQEFGGLAKKWLLDIPQKYGLAFVRAMDRVTVLASLEMAYDSVKARDPSLTGQALSDAASKEALIALNDFQPTGGAENRSGIANEPNPIVRMLSRFRTSPNATVNAIRRGMMDAKEREDAGERFARAKYASVALAALLSQAAMFAIIEERIRKSRAAANARRGGAKERRDEVMAERDGEEAANFALKTYANIVNQVPLVGDPFARASSMYAARAMGLNSAKSMLYAARNAGVDMPWSNLADHTGNAAEILWKLSDDSRVSSRERSELYFKLATAAAGLASGGAVNINQIRRWKDLASQELTGVMK